jgi:hypothetical protein
MRRRPHVDRDFSVHAETEDFSLFQNTEQFSLHASLHLRDLIEQKGSAIRPLEASFAPAIRACEGPALVAE